MKKEAYLNKYRRCLNEYIDMSSAKSVNEADPNADPNAAAMGGAQDPNAMGGDPSAMGMGGAQDPNAMGGDPSAMGMGGAQDPNAMGGDPNAMGGDPNAMGGQQGAMGFNPQGAEDPNAMGGAPAQDPNAGIPTPPQVPEEPEEDDKEDEEAKKEAEEKLEKLSHGFERVLDKLDSFESKIDSFNEKIANVKSEMEKRNPTPEEKLTLRSRNYSAPFTQPTDEYWDEKERESNYSAEDDHNGEDMPEYQITKSDIDNIADWHGISKKMGLKDVLDF